MHRKRPKRPIITKNYALQGFQLVIPEMFSNFVKVSFYKHSTNISNDMTKKLILAAAMLLTGSAAVAAQPKVISHRGYWTAPNSAQNSLASFTKADSVGVFGSEIDVWLTADDKLIVNHDRVYRAPTSIRRNRRSRRSPQSCSPTARTFRRSTPTCVW